MRLWLIFATALAVFLIGMGFGHIQRERDAYNREQQANWDTWRARRGGYLKRHRLPAEHLPARSPYLR